MAKAQYIIEMAYTVAGMKAIGSPLDGDSTEHGFLSLNTLMDAWQADGLNVPYLTETVGTVTGSPVSLPSGTFTVRPNFIRDTSFVRSGGVDFPVTFVSEADFNRIVTKSMGASFPFYGYYDGAVPIGKLYLYPTPTNAELHLIFDAVLPKFADYTTDCPVDGGYELALYLSLAERLCLGVKNVPDDLIRQAEGARRTIRTNNAQINRLKIDSAVSPRARFFR
jgi:hypothetical protein